LYYDYIWVILVDSHCIVFEMAQKSEHAAAGKAASAHSHHVKRVKGGKKREPIRRSREAKAAPQQEHPKGVIALKQEDSVMGVPIKLIIGIRQEMKKPYQFVRREQLW
jgi:hypothetical protein